MTGTRLTAEQCQELADRTMRSFESLGASEALARFGVPEHHVDDVVTDNLTGKPFRRIIFATAVGEHEVYLTVAISPEPVIVRRARRFRLIAEFMEGWRGSAETRQTTKVIKR